MIDYELNDMIIDRFGRFYDIPTIVIDNIFAKFFA